MKYLKILLLSLFPLFATAQPLGTWPVQYGDTPPTHTPSGSGTRIYLNISTNELYNWNPAPVSSWVKYPKGFDQISGCAAPGYTPTARQSVFAVNSCTALQNGRGPELYQYTGSQWVCLNCYPAYTAGTGIGISSGVITNTAPDQVVSISGVGITPSGTYPNFTLTAADQSATNELQNLSLSGQSLGISSGTGVTLPVVGVTAGTGIGVSSSSGNFTVSNTGDLSNTNELNTSFSVSGSNLALTDAGGTINVPVSSIAPVQAVAAGSGISISGTTTRTITAADASPTNELQTLSIDGSDLTLSNGGGTVTLPGGADGNGIYGGSGTVANGTVATVGTNSLRFGDISTFLTDIGSAIGSYSTAQNFELTGYNDGADGQFGHFFSGKLDDAESKVTYDAYGLKAESSADAGATLNSFYVLGDGVYADVQSGAFTVSGNGFVLPSLTTSQRNALSGVSAGTTIYCTNATANDASTGVLQTYNGSTWKNHW